MNASMTPTTASSTSEAAAKPSRIDRLFARLLAMYGARFADMWAGVDAAEMKAVWREGLGDLSPTELRHGIDACLTRKWPPTLPEFRLLCRPELDLAVLFHRAVAAMVQRRNGQHADWPSRQLFWAAQRLGHDLLTQPYAALEKRWLAAWLDAAADQHKDIPQVGDHAALPAPGKTTLSRDEASQRVQALRQVIGTHPTQWAYDIANRTLTEPARVSLCQIGMAASALRRRHEDLTPWPALAEAAARAT